MVRKKDRYLQKKTKLEELYEKQAEIRDRLYRAHFSNMSEGIKTQIQDMMAKLDLEIYDELEREKALRWDKDVPDVLDISTHGKDEKKPPTGFEQH